MVTVHKVCVEMNSYTVYKVFSGLMFSTKNDSYVKIHLFDTPKANRKSDYTLLKLRWLALLLVATISKTPNEMLLT